MTSTARGRSRRADPLSRAGIIDAARGLVERDGVEQLTMRRLAAELEAAPMSLYRHVADKRDVIMDLLDVVARELLAVPASAHPEPQQRLVETVVETFRVLEANRWVIQAVLAVQDLPVGALELSERMFAAMREMGFDARTAALAHTAIWQYTWGSLYFGHMGSVTARLYDQAGQAVAARYPEVARVVDAAPSLSRVDSFEAGLVAVIRGFAPT